MEHLFALLFEKGAGFGIHSKNRPLNYREEMTFLLSHVLFFYFLTR